MQEPQKASLPARAKLKIKRRALIDWPAESAKSRIVAYPDKCFWNGSGPPGHDHLASHLGVQFLPHVRSCLPNVHRRRTLLSVSQQASTGSAAVHSRLQLVSDTKLTGSAVG